MMLFNSSNDCNHLCKQSQSAEFWLFRKAWTLQSHSQSVIPRRQGNGNSPRRVSHEIQIANWNLFFHHRTFPIRFLEFSDPNSQQQTGKSTLSGILSTPSTSHNDSLPVHLFCCTM